MVDSSGVVSTNPMPTPLLFDAPFTFKTYPSNGLLCCDGPEVNLAKKSTNPGAAGGEGSLVFVCWIHLDLIASRVGVHKAEELVACSCINHLVYAGQWKAILWTSLNPISKIDADSIFHSSFLPGLGWRANLDKVSPK